MRELPSHRVEEEILRWQGEEQQQGHLLQHRLRELRAGRHLLHADARPDLPAGGPGEPLLQLGRRQAALPRRRVLRRLAGENPRLLLLREHLHRPLREDHHHAGRGHRDGRPLQLQLLRQLRALRQLLRVEHRHAHERIRGPQHLHRGLRQRDRRGPHLLRHAAHHHRGPRPRPFRQPRQPRQPHPPRRAAQHPLLILGRVRVCVPQGGQV
mmetsp:Transcript_7699/g.17611  ORF Transcript_7699/g.17611 Transcript_7699/m.17611 type:complete len:211 (-) Transcript_7699:2168-2800(-)